MKPSKTNNGTIKVTKDSTLVTTKTHAGGYNTDD